MNIPARCAKVCAFPTRTEPMKSQTFIALVLLLLTTIAAAAGAPAVQQRINQRYQDYFGPDSQALLPFPQLEAAEWHRLQAARPFIKVYTEPGKYYNSKVYTFTLYQAADDGSYYLNAKGGFWGMDELVYGPISEAELK